MDFVVPNSINPLPIKDFLRRHIGFSLTIWRKIKQSGTIAVNNQNTSFMHIVYPGDIITVHWQQNCTIVPTKLPITICYEDEYILIIDKPAGMLVHPTTSEHLATLANAVMHYFQVKQLPYGFHPVHRLDRNTSGLVLIAKVPHIQHLLSRNEVKNINRQYLALTTGTVTPAEGTIDAPIARHPDSIIQRMIHDSGQHATTRYKVLKNLYNASLVELTLLTGRTHQIRVHLSHIGHPLLGDDLYGGSRELIGRQALHAARLSFIHPVSNKEVDVSSPLPIDLLELVKVLDHT
ncbi:MAG: RluA family pseudouridine synthase [Sporomusaceae bacterium]|nr:RluA family pseudouridine synthase [Sporomusaceae bacterium]